MYLPDRETDITVLDIPPPGHFPPMPDFSPRPFGGNVLYVFKTGGEMSGGNVGHPVTHQTAGSGWTVGQTFSGSHWGRVIGHGSSFQVTHCLLWCVPSKAHKTLNLCLIHFRSVIVLRGGVPWALHYAL